MFMKRQSAAAVTAALCSAVSAVVAEEEMFSVQPDDPRIAYSGFIHKEFLTAPSPRMRFDRQIPHARNYERDNPAVRIRFRTDARKSTLKLICNELHISPSRNGIAVWRIDGVAAPEWFFDLRRDSAEPVTFAVSIAPPASADGGMHDYEILLPYGEAVDVGELRVNAEAKFEAPPPCPARRVFFFGDSVTHGFTSSRVDRSYPVLLGDRLKFEVVNGALGGIGSNPAHGAIVGAQKMDQLVMMIGVNDWQSGVPPERYAANVAGFLDRFRALQPETPVLFITPLWVAPAWRPQSVTHELEEYRRTVTEQLSARHDPNLVIVDGDGLIDHDAQHLFDPVAVHPNDAGFAQLAERLAPYLETAHSAAVRK